jgi:ribosome-associated protein
MPEDLQTPIEQPSKTALKNESLRLRKQGASLIERKALWARLELPDTLIQALQEAKNIRSFNGRKRQLLYVGKLMRQLSPEIQARITQVLAKI